MRKQVYELNAQDLETIPAWEFALDEEGLEDQDEATVRPYTGSSPIDPAGGQTVVRTIFKLADGTTLKGVLSVMPSDQRELGDIQPVVLFGNSQINFWFGAIKPSDLEIEEYFKLLNRTPSQIFPVQYASDVEIAGGPIAGTIESFEWMHL